jgi:hypothetical protein
MGAQDFTKPAEIAGIQEANTAILPSGQPLNELLLRSSQVKWAHDEAAKQREEKQMADNLAMFDFDTVGVWDKDLAAINKLKDDGIKKFGDVNFLKRYNNGDLNALSEYQAWKTGLQSSIDLSKRRMVYDGANRELMNKDKKYQNDINIQNAKKFQDTPLSGDFYSMNVTPSANPYDIVAYSTSLAPDVTETTEVKNPDGTFTKQIVTAPKLTGNKSLQSAAADILKDTAQKENANQLLVDLKTTNDPNTDYITYDFNQIDNLGNPIPIHKKVADVDQVDIVNAMVIGERWRPITDQTLEGSVYHPPQGKGLSINLGNGVEVPQTSLDRYKFIREGLIDKPENLTSLLIGGKLNGGTIVKVERKLAGTTGKGLNTRIEKKYDLELTYDKDGIQKKYTIKVDPETSQGVLEVNNILNQIREGTSQFVNPEDINKIYQSDYEIGGILESVQPKKPTQSSGTQQQGGVKKDWSKYKRN